MSEILQPSQDGWLGGRYELLATLGTGGMAVVHRALDHQRGVYCAVKVLLPHYASRKKLVKRFEAEARLMTRIDHRNVLAVTDVGVHREVPYFVMEICEGGSLGGWLSHYQRPMGARMALEVAIQICKGVGAAHAVGVVHRDLKPDNVLLSRRGVCKVADFGIARIDDERLRFTAVGAEMGTHGFMAPEQRDDAAGVDVRADVFSIGATLFTLVTGRVSHDLFMADRHPQLLEGVPEPLIPILLCATSYLRDQRYGKVGDLAKALFDARAGIGPDPADTPPLVLPLSVVQGAQFDPARPVTYELDTDDEPSLGINIPVPARDVHGDAGVSVAPPPARREVSVLPALRRDEVAGAELARAPEPARTPDLAHLPEPAAPPEPAPQSTLASAEITLEPAKDEDVVLLWLGRAQRGAVWLGAPIIVFAMVLGLWGAAEGIREAEREAIRAQTACTQAMGRERPLLDALRSLGAQDKALEQLAEAERIARGTPDWEPAATAYLARLEPLVARVSKDGPADDPRLREARARTERLVLAWTEYQEAVQGWRDASESFPASVTVDLGIARGPDP